MEVELVTGQMGEGEPWGNKDGFKYNKLYSTVDERNSKQPAGM